MRKRQARKLLFIIDGVEWRRLAPYLAPTDRYLGADLGAARSLQFCQLCAIINYNRSSGTTGPKVALVECGTLRHACHLPGSAPSRPESARHSSADRPRPTLAGGRAESSGARTGERLPVARLAPDGARSATRARAPRAPERSINYRFAIPFALARAPRTRASGCVSAALEPGASARPEGRPPVGQTSRQWQPSGQWPRASFGARARGPS